MNTRERFHETMAFRPGVVPPKWEFGYRGGSYENWYAEGLPRRSYPFERHFAPKYGAYFAMVHRHGARTMMHMCGTVWPFLDRLIELGLDVYDVVQPTTPENDIGRLAARFGDRLLFQGSMDVQRELVFGSPEDVRREVRRRLGLFPRGGLVFGPSHAVQAGSPLENVLAMYREAGSLLEEVPPWVYGIAGPESTEINLSKLF